jgi:hypothetical protein
MTTPKHGSGESDDDLNPSPARSTLSSTVSFPPGSRQSPGVQVERNPLLVGIGSPEEALLPDATSLERATPQGLIRYLEYKGTPTEAVDQISQHRLTGEQWIGVYGQGEAAAAVAIIMGDYPALPSLRARVLIWEAQEALKSKQAAAEVDLTAKLTAAAASPVKPSAQKEQQEQSSRRTKVETAPKLGAPLNALMYTGSELSTLFSKLGLWLAPKSDGLARGLHKIQSETLSTQCDVGLLRDALPAACATLDEELAAELVGHLPKCLESEIVKVKDNHLVNGRASSLRIMQALKNRVEHKTKSRGSSLLHKLMVREPCKAKQELQGSLTALIEEYEQLERMGCTPADQDAVLHPALVRAMSVLEHDADVGPTVLAKMASVEESHPGDSEKLKEKLKLLAADWAVDFADTQGSNAKSSWLQQQGRQQLASRNATQGADRDVMGASPFTTPCFGYREQGVCNLGDLGCPHVHEGRTGVQCTDDQFVQTGMCRYFKSCLNMHKYDEQKFGKIKDALAKLPAVSPERMALKHSSAM